ncbi:hypothetical protein WBG78_20205 [Chryseolinea sp. T2]|uniref:hypothetical protein n=1 Tax=Chryseolinea sp. T2 TaxID=3129255 RepID=UPI003076C6E5
MKSLQAYTSLIEKIFLIGLIVGVLFIILHMDPFDVTVTSVSLFGLALAFFLSAYKPGEIKTDDGRSAGMKEMLAFVIVPKVLWISSSVSLVGIALLVLGSDSRGYQQMLFIGGSTLAVAILIALFISVTEKNSASVLKPVLLRAVPVLLADLYFFLG